MATQNDLQKSKTKRHIFIDASLVLLQATLYAHLSCRDYNDIVYC